LKFEKIITAYVFQLHFSLNAIASAYLQSTKLNYVQGFSLLHSIKNNLKREINNFESIFNKATEFAEFIKIASEKIDRCKTIKLERITKLKSKRVKRKKIMPREVVNEESLSE